MGANVLSYQMCKRYDTTHHFHLFKYEGYDTTETQLESPNSEHRNSRYVRNNPDYSMSKADAGIFLANGPTLSEFLGHLGSEFDDSYFLSFVLLEVYFNWSLESPKSDKK